MKKYDPTRALKPGQVTRTKRHIKEYAQHLCHDMIDVLYEIAMDQNNYPRDRIEAAESLLNRGYGRPVDSNKMADNAGSTYDVSKLSSDDLMRMINDFDEEQYPELPPLPSNPENLNLIASINDELDEDIINEE